LWWLSYGADFPCQAKLDFIHFEIGKMSEIGLFSGLFDFLNVAQKPDMQ